MKILIDCYQLIKGQGKSIGIYNYTKHLLDKLIPQLCDENEVILLNNKMNIEDFNYDNAKNIIVEKEALNVFRKIKWEILDSSILINRIKPDIYFSPRGFLPPFTKKCKLITTVHDLIPVYYKKNYKKDINFWENLYIVKRLERSCKRADKIITISNFSKKEIIKEFNIEESKICTVYNGLDRNINVDEIEGKNIDKYIFSITSSSLKHKNLYGVLKSYDAYCKVSKNPMKLKICGVKNYLDYESLVSKECWNKIEFLPYLSDGELNWYYKNAKVFLFLSKIEGFGFPPLEALRFYTPAICSNIGCFREILGEGVELINEDNYDDVAKSLVKYEYSDKSMYNIDINLIYEKYDWSKNADEVKELFIESI